MGCRLTKAERTLARQEFQHYWHLMLTGEVCGPLPFRHLEYLDYDPVQMAVDTAKQRAWLAQLVADREMERCMAIPTKKDVPAARGGSSSTAQPGELLSLLPELWEFLTKTSLPDGGWRKPGKLSVICERTGLRLTLTDDSTGLYASLVAPSLEEVLSLAESQMKEGSIAWRISNFSNGKKQK